MLPNTNGIPTGTRTLHFTIDSGFIFLSQNRFIFSAFLIYVLSTRHRLMIPIRDIEGNIIGYGGRELPDEQPSITKKPVAKYVNTPTTAGNTE
jgi:hypothetical protein